MAPPAVKEGDLRYILPGRFAWYCLPDAALARGPPALDGCRLFSTDQERAGRAK